MRSSSQGFVISTSKCILEGRPSGGVSLRPACARMTGARAVASRHIACEVNAAPQICIEQSTRTRCQIRRVRRFPESTTGKSARTRDGTPKRLRWGHTFAMMQNLGDKIRHATAGNVVLESNAPIVSEKPYNDSIRNLRTRTSTHHPLAKIPQLDPTNIPDQL